MTEGISSPVSSTIRPVRFPESKMHRDLRTRQMVHERGLMAGQLGKRIGLCLAPQVQSDDLLLGMVAFVPVCHRKPDASAFFIAAVRILGQRRGSFDPAKATTGRGNDLTPSSRAAMPFPEQDVVVVE